MNRERALLTELAARTATGTPQSPQSKEGWQEYCQRPHTAPRTITLTAYQKLTDKERVAFDVDRLEYHLNLTEIHTQHMRDGFKLLNQAFALQRSSHAPLARTGVFFTGPPNSGKSTIITAWMRRMELLLRDAHKQPYGTRDAEGVEFLPCAYFSVTPTLKGFLGHGLAFYDTVQHKTSDVHILQTALTTHINTCHTHIIGLDQLQALAHIRAGAIRVSESLKYLMDTCPHTLIIGAGIGLEELDILTDGHGRKGTLLGQTGSRFILHHVTPYSNAQSPEFLRLLVTIEHHLRLLRAQSEDLQKQAALIFDRTRGTLGSIMHLIRSAAYTALLTGEERITTRLLEEVELSAFAQGEMTA